MREIRTAEIAAERTERARAARETRDRDLIDSPHGFISNFDPSLEEHSLGRLSHECEFCEALHFLDEQVLPHKQFTSCCVRGDAYLEPLRPTPPELRRLLTEDCPEGREFRKNIRAYNSALAFTSISYNKDTRINLDGGIQCFQIHGELFHIQGPLRAEDGRTPAFAQLFFYDPDYATDLRMDRYPTLNRAILSRLLQMLSDCNPYIDMYKTARERLEEPTNTQFRLLLNPQMRLIMETGADRRRENLPTSNEVAGILSDEFDGASSRDIVLAVRNPRGRDHPLNRINPTHAAYMPLHYVLLFPCGDYGWHYDLRLREGHGERVRPRLEQRQFYRYRLHTRSGERSTLFYGGRLFQQYVVDAFAACEATALDWIRKHQDKIRADVYQGLQDNLIHDDIDAAALGRRIVLPSSFTGGERFMQQLFQDSMAIVRHFGKPTFFITFTANPRWKDITEFLEQGQQPSDRPDLIARVFRLKVKQVLADLKKGLFGPYQGHVYTIEYQKRGLPHMHLLLWLGSSARFLTPERIDQVICAELPPASWGSDLREIVTGQMTHGPCGDDNEKAPCMASKTPNDPLRCQKNFPKPFSPATVVREDSYPEYRRRDNGDTFTVPKPRCPGQTIVRDNRWVVPYNPYLLQKYRCHMNVEICATVEAVKYINKYVYKGSDRTTAVVSGTDDEINRYITSRYIGPQEAVWRLFEFSMHQEWPPVQRLPVHLPGEQTVCFSDDATASQLANIAERARSKLMAFFLYNEQFADGREYLYSDFPAHYTWKARTNTWVKRQRLEGLTIGRMYHCNPISGERYYLRLLLTTVRGAQSFEELYFVNGIRHPTYHAACIARGLAENDREWHLCFDEAIVFTSGRGLRALFLTGLRQQVFANPLEIWRRYGQSFCDDLRHKLSTPGLSFPLVLSDVHHDYGLWLIAQGLADQQRSLTDVALPENVFDWSVVHARITQQETGSSVQENHEETASEMVAKMNDGQKACFDTIVRAVTDDPQTAHFYLQGPGGTGKTFVYKALYHHFSGKGKRVMCVASTGIAALLLPNGRTSHSLFRIPIQLNETSVSSISKSSAVAAELKKVDLIIWDEVPMQHKYCFEVVHRLMVDLRSTSEDTLFGGVPFILGGDFAQILPVVPNGSRTDIVSASLQRSFIWARLKRLYLRTNMRVRNTTNPQDQAFVQWISSLSYTPELNGPIKPPPYLSQAPDILDLIQKIYPAEILLRSPADRHVFRGRVILSTLNQAVVELNHIVLRRFPGQLRTYNSVDSTDLEEGEGVEQLPVEHLQSIDLPSLPPSKLALKVGVPVMLLRNLCPKEGLCNGTRMVVTNLRNHCIEGRLLGGDFDGQLRTIPRIKLSSGEKDLTFTLTRKQFPVRVCFAMTINKSQGQSFEKVAVDLRTPVFCHGQFYVAVSRVSSAAGLHMLLPTDCDKTTNIVWPEVLQDLSRG